MMGHYYYDTTDSPTRRRRNICVVTELEFSTLSRYMAGSLPCRLQAGAIGAVGVMMAARAAVVPRLGAERYLKYKN
jgi:hypothetical protein